MIDLRTLGALDLRRRDGPELHSVLAQAKRTAILVYLVLARPHGFHRRDTLTGLFWPERDTEHARNNLRQAVHFLRRSLGDDAIVSRGDEDIGLAEGVLGCDALQFEAALEAGEVEQGLGLYAGDLLPGFFVDEAPEFESWLEGERTRLRERALRACWSLAEAKARAGEAASAAEWGRRAVEIAPADDTQVMRLMQLLARAGDRSEALAAFEAYARRLRTELEVEPTEVAAALAEEIRRAQPGPPEQVAAHIRGAMTAAEAVEPGPNPPARTPAAPIEAQPSPPAVTSPAPLPVPPAAAESRNDKAGVRRDGVAPGLLRSGVAGVPVGIAVALLAVGLGHALRPKTVPVVAAGVLVAAAGLLLVEAALLAVWMIRRSRARVATHPSERLGGGLGFALGTLVTLSLAYTLAPHPPPPRAPAPGALTVDTVKSKVAVTRFANRTGDPAFDPVGRLAEDWVVRRLRSIPEAEVVAIASATAADTSLDAVTALAQRTGADLVLFGSYYREGGDVLLAASLVPPRGGRIPPEITGLAIGPVRAPRDRPLGGVDRLASMVAGAVAAECDWPACTPGRRAPMYEARQLSLEAFQAEARGEYDLARQKWVQANQLDSTFGSAYTHLAGRLSNCAQRDSIGEILEARRQDFGLVDLLYMRIMRAYCRGDFEAIYRLRRQQLEVAPGVPGSRAGLAFAAYMSGRLREAEARYRAGTFVGIHQAPLEYGGLADVLHLEGKIAEELRVAAEGRRRLPDDSRTPSLGLRGLAALGRTQELEARVEEARRGAASLLSVAQMYYTAALELEWHGHVVAARQFALSALRELDRASAAERADARYAATRVIILLELGRWGEARRLTDTTDLPDDIRVTVRGLASAGAGDVTGARAALATLGRLPDSAFAGYNLDAQWVDVREYCQASVLAALGEKDEALRRLEDAQARNTLPRSGPYFTHADYFPLRALWHDPRFERMFAARD